ncbi:unnamed protein product, partial [Pylaiella littoralis]
MSVSALASVPHEASALPASAVPTVLERFPGFVRCVMDIAPEVVGWVIGRSGAHIKEMKHRSGCGMWVDQKDLKLYITGADMPRIHAAAALVGDLISKAPVNVNSAGVEDEVTSHMIECPPHLIGLLIGRGGSTIKRIKEESRANVVINQKMMKVIVSGIPQSVRLGVAMIEDVITFGRSAEHGAGLTGAAVPPNFLDDPGAITLGELGGIPGIAEFIDDSGGALDRFTLRGATGHAGQQLLMPGEEGRRLGGAATRSLQGSEDQARNLSGRRTSFSAASESSIDGGAGGKGHHHQQAASASMAPGAHGGGGGGGRAAERAEMVGGYDGKDLDWTVFGGSSSIAASGSRAGSVSSGDTGTPPLGGRSMATVPWNVAGIPPLKGADGGAGLGGPPRMGNSPGAGLPRALLTLNRLSITSDDSNSGGGSLGQTQRHRERSGTAVGNPADLAEFLGAMGLGKYARALTDNEIDLEAVQLMADSDFQDVGIPKGPRVKLLYALRTNRHPPRSGGVPAMKAFLSSLGLERYCQAFEEAEVDMGTVDVMEESDYAQLGVAKVSSSARAGGGGGGEHLPPSSRSVSSSKDGG